MPHLGVNPRTGRPFEDEELRPPQIGFQGDFGAVPTNPINVAPGPIFQPRQETGGVSQLTDLAAGFGGPVGAGLAIGGRVFDFFGGAGKRAREQNRNRGQIFNELGDFSGQAAGQAGRLDPQTLTDQTIAGLEPRIQEFDRLMQERFGFDAGRAGQVLKNKIAELIFGIRPDLEFGAANFDLNAITSGAQIKANQGAFA